MTKSTITRERLEKIKSWRETYGAGSNVMLPAEEAEELARMALAAMDSEPVYQYQSGVYNDDNGETDWYWDDCDKGFYEQYAHDRRRILYRHAQPVVPDAAAVYAQLSDHEKWSTSLENVNHVLNAFRAAMLAAAQQEVKGE
ncbi:hypothetical protein JJJ21_18200 [Klebsiella grimontii]|uniref:hypothetical protein n=1 Tax=Klebsiella grimontii TaxID=2058152 RepID=UPI001939E3EA|nr:hypothetical protein [Klebsiella grimontii]MBM1117048.1 hypothetical protein [Klebsiella grimontii]